MGFLGRSVGLGLWLLREVVSGEVLLLLDRGHPLRSDLSDAGLVVRRLPAQRSTDRGRLGSDADGPSCHDPRRLGLGNGTAAALPTLGKAPSTAGSVKKVVDRAGESPGQHAADDEASENGDPHHEVKHCHTPATWIDGSELKPAVESPSEQLTIA